MKASITLFLSLLMISNAQASSLRDETLHSMIMLNAIQPSQTNLGPISKYFPHDRLGGVYTSLTGVATLATSFISYKVFIAFPKTLEDSLLKSYGLPIFSIAAAVTLVGSSQTASYNNLESQIQNRKSIEARKEIQKLTDTVIGIYNIDPTEQSYHVDSSKISEINSAVLAKAIENASAGKGLTVGEIQTIIVSQKSVQDTVVDAVERLFGQIAQSPSDHQAFSKIDSNKKLSLQIQINLAREVLSRLEHSREFAKLNDRVVLERSIVNLKRSVTSAEELVQNTKP